MPNKVFISHAGSDLPKAVEIAGILSQSRIEVLLDSAKIEPGDSLIAFMEKALTECDYCLLLWSKAASQRAWVQLEWEAALYKTIRESRRFLLVGRLEDHMLPALLGPRLMVELFPQLSPGIDKLISLWRNDNTAAELSGRPLGLPTSPLEGDQAGETVYITSELFGMTTPLRVSLNTPSGIHLDRIVSSIGLPTQYNYEGRFGMRMHYRFSHEGKILARSKSLASQGVREGGVLWLEVEIKPFSAITPVEGQWASATFRSSLIDAGRNAARDEILTAVNNAGLGVRLRI